MGIPKDVIIFSTADWDNPQWTNKQHMAVSLAKAGFRILYIESLGQRRPSFSAKDFSRILRRFIKGIRPFYLVKENIWVLSPLLLPFHQNNIIRKSNQKLLLRKINNIVYSLHFQNPIIFTYNPLILDLLPKINRSILIYHCVDDLTAIPGSFSNLIHRYEERLISMANFIFTSSLNLFNKCKKINPEKTFYSPNVADYSHFSQAKLPGKIPPDIRNIPYPRIGFIGALSNYKVDFDLISEIAKKEPNWHWVLIGEIGEGDPKTSIKKLLLPNIHILGPKPYKELPDYLRAIDIAVIPAKLNKYTISMFPMKFFEYMAAGKPIVSTNLPALKEYQKAFFQANSPHEFREAVRSILNGNKPDYILCEHLAQKNTWDNRLKDILSILES